MGVVLPMSVAVLPRIEMPYGAYEQIASAAVPLDTDRKIDLACLTARQEGDSCVRGALLAILLSLPFWITVVLTARFLR